MMTFQSKFNMIAPTQSRPLKSTIFPDHSHPTMLVESGQEPGDEIGWKTKNPKKNSKKEIRREEYKAKQRELYPVGRWSQRLSIAELVPFDGCGFDCNFVQGLPDIILIAPYDEGFRTVIPRLGWDHPNECPAVLCVAHKRDFYQHDQATTKTENSNHKPKEVPL
tara:strand:- start:28404 stop:28898 length:495 start_codon:yes stop_codon:yes gene_type:complete